MGDHEYQAPAQYNPPQIQHVQVQNHQQVNSVQYPSLGPPGPGPQGPQAQFVGQVQEPVAVQQQPQQVVSLQTPNPWFLVLKLWAASTSRDTVCSSLSDIALTPICILRRKKSG